MTSLSTDIATADLDYALDPALIARSPAHPRDRAKMLVLHTKEGKIEHRTVADLPDYLDARGKLIVNETRVAPLRFVARRVRDGRQTEGLFLGRAADQRWMALIKGAKRFAAGDVLELCAPDGSSGHECDRIRLHSRREMGWEVCFEGSATPSTVWERSGWTPLPPYIVQARKLVADEQFSDALDRQAYQTVFARASELASCAAPTAGLHFTAELLATITQRGIERLSIELQVGPGTFRPVESDLLSAHPMHHERCRVNAGAVVALAEADMDASLLVGTTSVRLLETIPRPIPMVFRQIAQERIAAHCPQDIAMDFVTNILISPGFKFQWTRRLLTNFHLPRSTLLALVGALVGLEQLKEVYALAQRERYRFYSFGDAMLILP